MVEDVTDRATSRGSFADFFRRYTKTWVHAVAAAGLTAFGTLTVVHRWFAALALAAYVVPPIVLYLSGPDRAPEGARTGADEPSGPVGEEGATGGDRDGDAGAPSEPRGDAAEWTAAESPVDVALFDAAVVPAGAYAVGSEGVVLADRGDGWTVALRDGPGAEARTLRGVDATGDGAAVWIAGDGGALARVDAATGRHTDFSAPEGITDAWTDLAVGGESGDETLLLVNGSGETLRGRYRGGDVAWDAPVKAGSGSSLAGVDLVDASVGYLCDTNDGVFETVDGGETFRRVGIEAAGTLTDVAAFDRGDCTVSADDGVLHRYDGSRWTPDRLDDGALWAIAGHGEYAVACGEGGVVHERTDPSGDWERIATAATGPLRGVAAGDDRAVAVGADGAVIERRR